MPQPAFAHPCLLALLFAMLSLSLNAQISLKGTITDYKTNQPIEAVHVFLENTTYGTLTAADGSFAFDGIPEGRYQLILSHIAYRSQNKRIHYKEAGTYEVSLKLFPASVKLSAIEVLGKKSKKRKRYLSKFTKAILGQTPFASKCRLLNPEAVLVNKNEQGHYVASASDLLQFENQATGYILHFLLEDFILKTDQVRYSGKAFFEPMPVENNKVLERWKKNRAIAYRGSTRHFYQSLANNQLKEAGFEVYHAQQAKEGGFTNIGEAKRDEIIEEGGLQFKLKLNHFLEVVYTKEAVKSKADRRSKINRASKSLSHKAEGDMVEQEFNTTASNSQAQTSWLFARKKEVAISNDGFPTTSDLLIEYGYWNTEGLADFVPSNLEQSLEQPPPAVVASTEIQTNLPKKNGFVLSNLAIPLEEIRSGGPPRDGIPAIDRPIFVKASEDRFLRPDDRIIGIHYQGIAKAYPIRILDLHEIVNDLYKGTPIAVTYCPLCRSGLAFGATINQQTQSFGVSGLLYNSDVLLYDRQTESLWSQILGQAISGPLAGTQLPTIPIEQTSWAEWQTRYPNSLVLSPNTGFNKSYQDYHYRDYESSSRLLFPVKHTNKRLNKKDLIIGLEVNGQYKAYPFKRLKKAKKPVSDQFNGQEVRVSFDAAANAARVTDGAGQLLKAHTMYWFAWAAFHPKTDVYK